MNTQAVVAKLNWAILPICCVMIGCCYLDRSNVAYMQLQLRRPPPAGMGFGPTLYGNASGLFFLGYSICQIPSNMMLVCCIYPCVDPLPGHTIASLQCRIMTMRHTQKPQAPHMTSSGTQAQPHRPIHTSQR